MFKGTLLYLQFLKSQKRERGEEEGEGEGESGGGDKKRLIFIENKNKIIF